MLGFTQSQAILTLINKKSAKRIINIYALLSQLNNAKLQGRGFCIYFFNTQIYKFLILFRDVNFIKQFYLLPTLVVKNLNVTQKFSDRLVLIFFYSNTKLKIISYPSRLYSVSYWTLIKLCEARPQQVYLVQTNQGLITSTKALQLKIGGVLYCSVEYGNV